MGGGHGLLNVSGAIQHSCNYFFFEVGYRLGIERIEEYARYFGLGEKTGVELSGETPGILAGKALYEKLGKIWYDGSTLSAAIRTSRKQFYSTSNGKVYRNISKWGKRH